MAGAAQQAGDLKRRVCMEKYKVSVIVPVYNTKKYLAHCVDTLVHQTYGNLEILLVDDGSADGSGELCDELARGSEKIRVIHKENGGLVSAWKKGVCESRGEYLCFVDSDDWVDTCMIADMAEHLSGICGEIIAGNYVIEREDGSSQYVWQALPVGEYDRAAVEKKVIPNLLGREHRYVTVSRCMKLIRRELILENMKYSSPEVVMGEDMTVMLPALIDCNRLVTLNKAHYHYRYVTESMVHKYDRKLYGNIQILREIFSQVVSDKFAGNELLERQKQVEQEYIFFLLLVLKNEARGNPKGYRKNIFSICKSEEVRRLVRETPVTVGDKANKLLYLTLRHPNEIIVRLLRLAMILYYRKGGRNESE